ncbi:MAG: DUF4145 domain-containing protein [Patescibacteria group bacterium]
MERVKCKICGETFSSGLATHINRKHKLSSLEYQKRFPRAKLVSDEYRQMMSNRAKDLFEKDPTMRKKVAERTFDFINSKRLQPLLQRDYKSAKICLKNSLWKPSIILYGSIIEAILIEKYPKAKNFNDALEIAHKNGYLSDMENHKIHIIRDLRNYVHLHKELSEGNGEISEHWAKTAADICESIIRNF